MTRQFVLYFIIIVLCVFDEVKGDKSNYGYYPRISVSTLDDIKYCPEGVWNGVRLMRTAACMKVLAGCPGKSTGSFWMQCDCKTAQWIETPNMSNCTHLWVNEISKAVDDGEPVEPIIISLANNIQNSMTTRLYGGDIVGSVEICVTLVSLADYQIAQLSNRSERSSKAVDFTQKFGEVGDHLLNEKIEFVWMELSDKIRVTKASSLMLSLQSSAAMMAKYLDEKQKKIDYSNWALQVQIKGMVAVPRGPTPFSLGGAPQGMPGSPADDSPFGEPVPFGFSGSESKESDSGESETISFTNFTHSPVLTLPSLDVIEESYAGNRAPVGFAFNPANSDQEGGSSLDRNPLRFGYYVFKSFGALLNHDNKTIINSLVIGASVNDPVQGITLPSSNPVNFTFYHIRQHGVNNARCVYWEIYSEKWSESGCTLLRTSDESTDCSCDHLTSFAILMDITGDIENTDNVALNVITMVGCALSAICLFLAFLVFTCFRSLWSVRHTIHRNLCLCLLLAELIFMFGINATSNRILCSIIAVALHYLFLAAFSWMLLEGYQLYLMLIQVFETNEVKVIIYYVFAYGFPAVVVAVSASIGWTNYGTSEYCWLNVDTPIIWAFVGPITVVITANLVFLGAALKAVLSVKGQDTNNGQRIFGWLKGSTMLLCLLGITWIFGYLIAITKAQLVFAYIFTVLNCSQGIFIFIFHVLLNERVRTTLIRFIQIYICCKPEKGFGYNAKSNISSQQKFLRMMIKGDSSKAESHQSTNSTGVSSPPPKISDEDVPQFFPEKVDDGSAKLTTYSAWKQAVDVDSLDGRDTFNIKDVHSNNENNPSEVESADEEGSMDLRKQFSVPVRRKKPQMNTPKRQSGSSFNNGSIVARF